MGTLIEVKHDGIEGTARIPRKALKTMKRWTPVNPDEAAKTEAERPTTVDAILAEVGDDAAKAHTYLDQEQASDTPRSTLVAKLQAVVAAHTEES